MKIITIVSLTVCLLLCSSSFAVKIYDNEVIHRIIKESIANFPASCACPYNKTHSGTSCGKHSAYSRAAEYGAICYPQDVTLDMIRIYRASH